MYCDLWISKFKKEEFPRKLYEEIRYIFTLISTSYSNDTFLQLLEFSLHPLIFVFLLLPKFVEPLASLVGLSPTLLFPLLIFSPENRSKKDFYNNDILISTYVLHNLVRLMFLVAHRFGHVEFSNVCFDFFNCACLWKTTTNTGIPRIVRFFGPQQTALLEKPH